MVCNARHIHEAMSASPRLQTLINRNILYLPRGLRCLFKAWGFKSGLALLPLRLESAACTPAHDHEAVVELTYQYALTPWLQLQPDLQYIIHPGSSAALKDAFVQGVRAGVRF